MILFAKWLEIIFVSVLLFSGTLVQETAAKKIVQQKLNQLRETGKPTDPTTLKEQFAKSSSKEVLEQWEGLLSDFSSTEVKDDERLIHPWGLGYLERVPSTSRWEQASSIIAFLDKYSTEIDELRALASKHQPVHFASEKIDQGLDTDLSMGLGNVQRIFGLEVQIAVREHDSAGVQRAIDAMLGVGKSLESYPFLVTVLVSLKLEDQAIEELRRALEENTLEEPELNLLLQRISDRTSWSSRLHHAIATERIFSLYVSPEEDGTYTIKDSIQRHYQEAIELIERYEKWDEIDIPDFGSFAKRAAQFKERRLKDTESLSILADGLIRREMRMRLATLALGLRIYERRFSKLPRELDTLKEIAMDTESLKPIGPKSFGYRVGENSFVLWGFDPQRLSETPEEPSSDSADPMVGVNAKSPWVWELSVKR